MQRKAMYRQLVEAGIALVVTYVAGKWAVQYAYIERGYEAVGGEYIFILAVYWAAYRFIRFVFSIVALFKEVMIHAK